MADFRGLTEKFTLTTLKVSEIKPNPDQPRMHFDQGALMELAASLGATGQGWPIGVVPVDDGSGHTHMIVDGERRWRAKQELGEEDIMCIVFPPVTPGEMLLMSLVANTARKEFSDYEMMTAVRKLRELGYTDKSIAEALGCSISKVRGWKQLLLLHPEVQEMLNPATRPNDRFSKAAALRIAVSIPRKEQPVFARMVVANNLTVTGVDRKIREFRGERRLDPEVKRADKWRQKLFAQLTRFAQTLEEWLEYSNSLFVQVFGVVDPRDARLAVQSIDRIIQLLQELKKRINASKRPTRKVQAKVT